MKIELNSSELLLIISELDVRKKRQEKLLLFNDTSLVKISENDLKRTMEIQEKLKKIYFKK